MCMNIYNVCTSICKPTCINVVYYLFNNGQISVE